MKEKIKQILLQIDLEIDEIDLYGYDIIETSLSMIHKLQAILNFSRHRNRNYSVVCYSSIRYTGLKRNARQGAMRLSGYI